MGSEKMNGDQLSNALLDVSLDDTSVPEPYVMPDHLLPKVAHDEFGHQKIPVIDLGGFQSCEGPEYKEIVSQLGDACENWGFFQVVNHGVKLELLKRVEAASLRFFALPLEEKQKVATHFAGDRVLGYGFLKLRTSMRAWSEGVYVDTSCIAEYSKLLWPDDEDIQHSFCETIEEYFSAMNDLSLKIVRLVVDSLGLPPENYDTFAPKSPGLLRMNHYPPCPDPSKALGLMHHSDGNLFTILHQGDVPGLQVLKDGIWVAVRPHRDGFVINVSDMLQVISNGRYKSAEHRAVVNKTHHRYSLAYFTQAPDWDYISPPPQLVDSEHPLRYRPFTWNEYLKALVAVAPTKALEFFAAETETPT